VLQDATIWEISEHDINGKYPVVNILGYEPKNLVWFGPLIAPPLDK
jgi:hypothetical protein